MPKGYVCPDLRYMNFTNLRFSVSDTALFDSTQLCIHLRTVDFIRARIGGLVASL
jgi:hypothetical protein